MADLLTETNPRDPGWGHWQRDVEIETDLSPRTVHDRIERLLRDGPRLQGFKGGRMEGEDRFRAVFAGNKTSYDVLVRGEITPRAGRSRVRLTFDSDTSLGMSMVILLVFCPLQVVLGNLKVAQAVFAAGCLALLFLAMTHLLGPALVTSRIRGWIRRALEE
jgi:hypothetical protein